MTDSLKFKIKDIIKSAVPVASDRIVLAMVEAIAKVVDEDVGKAILEGSNMQKLLDAVGLKIVGR